MTIDFFFAAVIVLFVQYTAVFLFIKFSPRRPAEQSLGFYALAALVGTVGFSLIFSLYKWYFGFTFVSLGLRVCPQLSGTDHLPDDRQDLRSDAPGVYDPQFAVGV